jgi:branched-chain amino acid transport system substrate-binding protein
MGMAGLAWVVVVLVSGSPAAAPVRVGLNYPQTGPYFMEGLDEEQGAGLALAEINAGGGISGRPVELVTRDSKSLVDVARANTGELIDHEGVSMVFGGAASNVAIAVAEICEHKRVVFFGTLAYANDLTDVAGHRHTFRECPSAWMAASVLSRYLNRSHPGARYFYVTADYAWGTSTEESLRTLTGTGDTSRHGGRRTPFPSTPEAMRAALETARAARPDVLVLVEFGTDLVSALNVAATLGLKDRAQIVVPNLTLPLAEHAGPENMAGVVGTVPWDWKVPVTYGYARGKDFVERFAARFGRYPGTAAASAYTILHEYKSAVERAGSLGDAAVVRALEGHAYVSLKDQQVWRVFDHQSVQTVYAVRGNPAAAVRRDRFKADFFTILESLGGREAAPTHDQWLGVRRRAGLEPELEKLD